MWGKTVVVAALALMSHRAAAQSDDPTPNMPDSTGTEQAVMTPADKIKADCIDILRSASELTKTDKVLSPSDIGKVKAAAKGAGLEVKFEEGRGDITVSLRSEQDGKKITVASRRLTGVHMGKQ